MRGNGWKAGNKALGGSLALPERSLRGISKTVKRVGRAGSLKRLLIKGEKRFSGFFVDGRSIGEEKKKGEGPFTGRILSIPSFGELVNNH